MFSFHDAQSICNQKWHTEAVINSPKSGKEMAYLFICPVQAKRKYTLHPTRRLSNVGMWNVLIMHLALGVTNSGLCRVYWSFPFSGCVA